MSSIAQRKDYSSRPHTSARFEWLKRQNKEKPFFGELVDFITSGPVLAFVLAGENAIVSVRALNGATNPVDAAPGSIRGDYALTMDAT